MFAAIAAVITFGLAHWEGAAIPAALSRSGVVFAAALTLCITVLSVLVR
ncbi:hypothetical protein [Streptomyces minutiscleroticus]|uniref:Uncharacterized protein n=1 Tax=Streptomyces minutiscleroticus TaxID=68238 RepID=A0A918NZ38_9ACTN|nr:hypothetical protein [Streptomyces minutiscleroticus]GGY08416.1 hypothetical protein GCM10010358_71850 [Streptomyces minutiscleroticus]